MRAAPARTASAAQKRGIMGEMAAQNRDNSSVQMLERNYTNAPGDYNLLEDNEALWVFDFRAAARTSLKFYS